MAAQCLSCGTRPLDSFLELLHSGEANKLRQEANQFRDEANEQRREANKFRDEANEQRREANKFRDEANEQRREANVQRERANQALSQIADHTKKAPTKAERNAERMEQYLRTKVQVVNANDSQWPGAAEIVEIKNEVVTLFTPAGLSSSSASAIHVQCEDLEIIDAPAGSPTLKVLKRYGTALNLGQIKEWEERLQPSTAPLFSKGPNVFNVEYTKPGSSERRRLDVFESADGQNSYMLVPSAGEVLYGDNVAISRQFMLVQLELEIQGFRQSGSGSGGGKHPLYIKTRS